MWGVGKTMPRDQPVASVSTATAGRSRGYMMGWTEADGDALFRQPPDEQLSDDAASVFDGEPRGDAAATVLVRGEPG
jgi:hypothetical protein